MHQEWAGGLILNSKDNLTRNYYCVWLQSMLPKSTTGFYYDQQYQISITVGHSLPNLPEQLVMNLIAQVNIWQTHGAAILLCMDVNKLVLKTSEKSRIGQLLMKRPTLSTSSSTSSHINHDCPLITEVNSPLMSVLDLPKLYRYYALPPFYHSDNLSPSMEITEPSPLSLIKIVLWE